MAFSFQPDPSLPNCNSFCTVAQADDYQETKLNTTWAGLSTANKQKLLAFATRQINTLSFLGVKTNPTQYLQFPRSYLPVDGGYTGSITDDAYGTYYLDPNTFPQFLYEATAETAGILMAGDVTADSGLGEFSKLKVDVIEISLKEMPRTSWLKSSVRNLLWRYLENSSPFSAPTRRVG